MTQQHQLQNDISSNSTQQLSNNDSIAHTKEDQIHLEKMAWFLEHENTGPVSPKQPSYGDVTTLNTDRTILDNVGRELLAQMSSDVLALLDTSLAVYEKNGDYAFCSLVSEWCWFMDNTSRKLCNTDDNRKALRSGYWHYHENSWIESAKPAIESGKPTDIACIDGMRLYAVPIYADNDVIGAINIRYGTPPTDEAPLMALSRKFGCDVEILRKMALSVKPRPPFLIEIAKKRLHSIALQIGKTVEAARNAALLKQAEKRNRSLLDYSPVCHKVIDLDFKLRYMNKMGFYMLKLEETTDRYGEPYPFDFFPQEHREMLAAALQQVKKTNKRVILEGLTCDSEGGEVWLFHNLIPVPNDDGSLDYITVVSSDITERKQAEQIIQESEEKFRALFRAIPLPTYTWQFVGDDFVLHDYNETALTFTEGKISDMVGIQASEMYREDEQMLQDIRQCFRQRSTIAREMEYQFKTTGECKYLHVKYAYAPPDFVMVHTEDFTERKQAEDQLKRMLADKETLLRELYHRTKNTLQVIRSMLVLQAAQLPDNEAVQKLVKDTENRIMSIALVHQKLYQSHDLSRIPVRDYLGELARLIVRSYTPAAQHITLVVEGEPLSLLLDTAIPCGLIVNELLSNALKYAFPENKQGEITIRVFRNDAGHVELSLADTGVGVPPGFDFRSQTTLGLQTIFAIAEQQMQGRVQFICEQGVTCIIEFPDTLYTERV